MKCQKFNHFSSVCKSKGPPNSKKWQEQRPNYKPPENPGHKRRIKKTTEEEDADNSKSSDDEFICQAVRHLKEMKKIKAAGEDRTVSVKIEDVDVRAEPDSGAEVNVLDEHQFKALANRSSVKLTLQPSRVKLSTLQSELPVKGEFTATVRNQTCGQSQDLLWSEEESILHRSSAKVPFKNWVCCRSEKMALSLRLLT